MALDGYQIEQGRIVAGSIFVTGGGDEVYRIPIPEYADVRVNTLCICQNGASTSDIYSYWIDVMVTREDGYTSFVDEASSDGYVYNECGSITNKTIGVSIDYSDLVFVSVSTAGGAYRLAAFSTVYEIKIDPWTPEKWGLDRIGDYTSEEVITSSGKVETLINQGNRYNYVNFSSNIGYIHMGDVLGFERTDAFSISFWIEGVNVFSPGIIISKIDGSPYTGYEIYFSSGKIAVDLINDYPGNNYITIITNSPFNDGKIHHVAVTYDGSSLASGISVYVDDVLQATSTTRDNLTGSILNNSNFRINGRSTGFGTEFRMFDLSVWDKELSSTEVTEIFDCGNAGGLFSLSASANLVGWWRLGNEISAPTVPDQTVNGYDGTMVNLTDADVYANDAVQTNASFQGTLTTGINGKTCVSVTSPSIQFYPIEWVFQQSSYNITVFAVYKGSNITNTYQYIFDCGGSSGRYIAAHVGNSSATPAAVYDGTFHNFGASSQTTSVQAVAYVIDSDSSTAYLYRNGALVNSTSITGRLIVGNAMIFADKDSPASYAMDDGCDFYRLVVLDRAATTDDLNKWFDWVRREYGL